MEDRYPVFPWCLGALVVIKHFTPRDAPHFTIYS